MLAFLLPLLSQITLSQAIAAVPQVINIAKQGIALYQTLTTAENLAHETALVQSVGLVGKAVARLVADTVGIVLPEIHEMTQDETNVWMSQSGIANQS